MKCQNRNFRFGEKLFEEYYKENGNAFMYSVGTVGYKYIWTMTGSETIVTSIDLKGKKETKEINSTDNWTRESRVKFEEPNCSMVLDGDILMLKFNNAEGQTIIKSLINAMDCLATSESPILMKVLSDMKRLKIR